LISVKGHAATFAMQHRQRQPSSPAATGLPKRGRAQHTRPRPAVRSPAAKPRPSRPARKAARPQDGGQSCAQAFRAVAGDCLAAIERLRAAAAADDPDALHQMRIQLTRLRATIAFFAPMLAGAELRRLKRELRWLNRRLGAARDIDALVARQTRGGGRPLSVDQQIALDRKWLDGHARLRKALNGSRHARLLRDLTTWIGQGNWSRKPDAEQTALLDEPVGARSARVLRGWHDRLAGRGRKLHRLGDAKLHRLRLKTKRLRYAIADFGAAAPGRSPAWAARMEEQLRRAQRVLGDLNDEVEAPVRGVLRHKAGARRRLLAEAEAAYAALAALR
jgi:CHAD domain-containing protein